VVLHRSAFGIGQQNAKYVPSGRGPMDDYAPHFLDEEREGRYANHFHIGHNAFEVILQFGQFYEGNKQGVMHTKIVTCPAYAETLLELLSRSLKEYEKTFGPIPTGRPHE
jgi:Protein of unknown function (DUF3467)